jgi:hypothetical protein
MSLRTATEPLYLELEVRFGRWADLLTPPTEYSRPIEIASLSLTPAEQQSIRVTGRNITTKGDTLLSLRRPTGTPAQLSLQVETYTPLLLALAMGGAVSEVTQASTTTISQAVTLAQGVAVPISARFLAAASVVVGTGDAAEVGTAGSNHGLTVTARQPTASGASGITITVVDPATASAALAVSVNGTDISVSLATDGDSDEISTAAEVMAAINAHAAASALVTVTHTGDSTGAGVMPAVSETALTGGSVVSPSLYEIDETAGFVTALSADAAGAQRVYAALQDATLDRYTGGSAQSDYIHLSGWARNAATGKRGLIDVWQANVASTAPLVAPQEDSGFQATFEGDMLVPSVAVRGITPTRAIQFDDRRV